MAKMKAPEGATSVTFDGDTFEVVGGVVTVPHDALEVLISHGFEPIGDSDDQDEVVEQTRATKKSRKAAEPDAAATE